MQTGSPTLMPSGTPARGPSAAAPSLACRSSRARASARAWSAATVMNARTCGSVASSLARYCSVTSSALHWIQQALVEVVQPPTCMAADSANSMIPTWHTELILSEEHISKILWQSRIPVPLTCALWS